MCRMKLARVLLALRRDSDFFDLFATNVFELFKQRTLLYYFDKFKVSNYYCHFSPERNVSIMNLCRFSKAKPLRFSDTEWLAGIFRKPIPCSRSINVTRGLSMFLMNDF